MGKIADIVTSPSGGFSDVISAIVPKIPAIVLMVFLKKCMENAGDVYSGISSNIWKLIKKVLYTDVVLTNCNSVENLDYYFKRSIQKRNSLLEVPYFPLYWNMDNDEGVSILSCITYSSDHNSIIEECREEAVIAQSVYDLVKNQKKVLYKTFSHKENKLSYVKSNASKLYPSKNYQKLVECIRTHFDVSTVIESYSVIGMLIDGLPGLGKTKFADFAVEEKLAGHIYKVDMTTMLKFSFEYVLESMYREVDIVTHTIFMIDEIDKYVDYRINYEYNELQNAVENVVNSTSNSKDVISHEVKPKNIKSFEEFRDQVKTTFLYDMLSILERDGLKYSVVVIFCSNNFHSIFEGVDLTHHKSLYDRFMKIKFEECDHSEIIEYILHYNEKFKTTKYHSELSVDILRNSLRKDIKVTHRTLHHISIDAKYNATEMIRLLNIYKSEDDSGEALSDKIAKVSKTHALPTSISVTNNYENIMLEKEKYESDDDEDDEDNINGNDIIEEEIKDFPAHKQVWYREFVHEYPSKNVSPQDISVLLNKAAKCYETGDSKFVVIELFDIMAEGGYIHMIHNEKLFNVMKDKIIECTKYQPSLMSVVKPRTKKFFYAVSGIDVENM
jgi:hypothetical protein